MGNQPSSSGNGGGGGGGNSASSSGRSPSSSPPGPSVPALRLPPFLSPTGSLKLSRSELDRRCQPSGLYPTTPWDPRAVRRLIGDGRLAARLGGTDARARPTDQECPICFLHYAQVNITKCCAAAICTECYLQVRPQKEKAGACPCPFCNAPKLSVRVAKMMTGGQVQRRDAEEQRVLEARLEARKAGLTGESGHAGGGGGGGGGSGHGRDGNTSTRDSTTFGGTGSDSGDDDAPSTPQPYRSEQTMQSSTGGGRGGGGGSGSTAPNTPRTPPLRPGEFGAAIERYRSESFASSDGVPSDAGSGGTALTLTPTQRSQIHAQLRSQNDHPLARQMAEEARRRREDNELEYYRANSGRLLERYEEYQRRALRSRAMADRVLLQAHGIPTRGEAGFGARSGGGGGGGPGATTILAPRNGDGSGGLDSAVIEAALMMSMEEEAERQRRREAGDDGGGDGDAAGSGGGNAAAGDSQPPSLAALLSSSSARAGAGTSGSRRRMLRARSGRGPTSTHIGTAGMLMQGISEEDQVAMAIALSLRESENAQNGGPNDGHGEEEAGDEVGAGSSGPGDRDDANSGNNSEASDAQDATTEDDGTERDDQNQT